MKTNLNIFNDIVSQGVLMRIVCCTIVFILFNYQLPYSAYGQDIDELVVSNGCRIEMVSVPSGSVYFGCPPDEITFLPSYPYELKQCDEFQMSKFEITNRQYLEFYQSEEFSSDEFWEMMEADLRSGRANDYLEKLSQQCSSQAELMDLPFKCYALSYANAFAIWCSKQTGLEVGIPTAIEWEYAAEGSTSQGEIKLFPWGDLGKGNYIDESDMMMCNSGAPGELDPFEKVAPVGSMPGDKSWCGAMDMAGNLREITSTYLDDGTLSGQVVKGGGYFIKVGSSDYAEFADYRGARFFCCSHFTTRKPSNIGLGVGFRIVVRD